MQQSLVPKPFLWGNLRVELGNRAPLADVLRRLNSLEIQNIGVQGFFFTLAAVRIDRSGRTIEMIVRPGAEPRQLPSQSTILGTLPDAVDADATLYAQIEPGDRIVLYTDGLTDVSDSRGEMLEVLNRVATWRDGPPVDDVSLVLVEVR
jgi:serine phosphatase RsbU (regulator of sigma subunit)